MDSRIYTLFNSKEPSKELRRMHTQGRLATLFPEIANLEGVAQPIEHHPEGDALEHTFLVVASMEKLTTKPERRFSALLHDVGKGITPKELLPKHHDHEKKGIPLVVDICNRLQVPQLWRECALFGTEHHGRFHRILQMRAVRVVDFINLTAKNPLGVTGLAELGLSDARGKDDPDTEHECYHPWIQMWNYMESNPPLPHERPDDVRVRHASEIKRIQRLNTRF